jgi:hypothetical protein
MVDKLNSDDYKKIIEKAKELNPYSLRFFYDDFIKNSCRYSFNYWMQLLKLLK